MKEWLDCILGDPGAVSGGGKKSKRARKNSGAEKSFLTFQRPNFFLAPTNCPWVFEDGSIAAWMFVHPTNTAAILDYQSKIISITIRMSLLLLREKVKHVRFLKSIEITIITAVYLFISGVFFLFLEFIVGCTHFT